MSRTLAPPRWDANFLRFLFFTVCSFPSRTCERSCTLTDEQDKADVMRNVRRIKQDRRTKMSDEILLYLKRKGLIRPSDYTQYSIIGIMLPDPEPTDSITAAQTLTGTIPQDKEWINNTENNISVVQQTDTAYKNECEQDGATYQSKYYKAVDVENIALQAAGISQQATVSPNLQEVKANYENYLAHLRLYAAGRKKHGLQWHVRA